jgi:flagellar hook-length control protein FliK
MNTGRPIHLDLGMPSSAGFDTRTGTGPQTGGDPRETDTLTDDAKALRALVEQQRAASQPGTSAPAPAAPRPFDLFGAGAAIPVAPGPATAVVSPAASSAGDVPRGVDEALSQMAKRLLVADGSTGRRAVQIQLADESLPGVAVEIFEEAGQVVAQFTCTQESTRERLVRNAQWLADNLAGRLERSVCVRVQTDDPEDLCLVEACAGL